MSTSNGSIEQIISQGLFINYVIRIGGRGSKPKDDTRWQRWGWGSGKRWQMTMTGGGRQQENYVNWKIKHGPNILKVLEYRVGENFLISGGWVDADGFRVWSESSWGRIFDNLKHSLNPKYISNLIHKLRHPGGGYGGVSQKMTQDDKGGGDGGLEHSKKRWCNLWTAPNVLVCFLAQVFDCPKGVWSWDVTE